MIIIRYSEIFLKGKNKMQFEQRLVENMRAALRENKSTGKIINGRTRFLISDDNATYLKDLPGIHSISVAQKLPIDLEVLKKAAFNIAKENEHKFSTFKIDTKRISKDNNLNSVEIDRTVGEDIYENLHKQVSLQKPEFTIYIEILDQAYMFTEKIAGPGGLPVGVEGKVFAIIDDEPGLTAAKMMMRRGCIVYPAYFKENKFKDEIQKISPGFKIREFLITNLTNFEELESQAGRLDVKALVVSDTIKTIKEYKTTLPIFRPLISI